MLVDEWRGRAAYRSPDGVSGQRQVVNDGLILDDRGIRAEDATVGRHADVVVVGDTATVVSFTHPFWDGTELGAGTGGLARRSSVQAAPLRIVDGEMRCDRNTDDALPLRYSVVIALPARLESVFTE
jgi:hypothetical protein